MDKNQSPNFQPNQKNHGELSTSSNREVDNSPFRHSKEASNGETIKIQLPPHPNRKRKKSSVPPLPSSSASSGASTPVSSGAPVRISIPEHPGRRSSQNASPSVSIPEHSGRKSSQNASPSVSIPEHSGHRNAQNASPSVIVPVHSGRKILPQHPGSAPAVRAEKSYEELAHLASSVVMIAVHDKNGEVNGTGSGIMIGRKGYILTNDHVARSGYGYSIKIENDDTVYQTEELIKYNSSFDLAILRISRTLQPLPVYQRKEPLVRGQRVIAIGSPLGLFNSVSDGIISGFRTINDTDMIQFTAPISQGSSGGAVLNLYGEVIGISTAGFDTGQNINLAIGYECINLFARGFWDS